MPDDNAIVVIEQMLRYVQRTGHVELMPMNQIRYEKQRLDSERIRRLVLNIK